MSVWALTLAQDNQLLTRCSHSLLYLAFPLFVKKLLIPEVCMYCMYMYVCTKPYYRTWTYQPEKMSHTSLCVRVVHHFASWVRWDKPGSSLFIWSIPTVRAWWSCQRRTATATNTLTLQAGWCLTSTILLFLQTKYRRHSHDDIQQRNTWQHQAFVCLFGLQHNDTCHVSSHAAAAGAPLYSQISQ